MEDPKKVQHQIDIAERVASTISDPTTAQRFIAFAQDLRQRLQNWQIARRRKHEISARAYDLWERAGKPSGRDEEFWLTAEQELNDNREGEDQ